MGVPEKALIEGGDILKYIPQRPPAVMVDTLWEVTDDGSVSGLTVAEDNIFCRGGILEDCGVLEHIAQSAALRIGYLFVSRGEEVPLGFIGSIGRTAIHFLPRTGEKVRTRIRVEQEVFGITLLTAESRVGGRLAAECEMKVAVTTDDNKR